MATKFKVGDLVSFVNDYGCKFPENRVMGLDLREGEEPRYYLDNSAPWYSIKESKLIHDGEDTVLAIEGGHKIRYIQVDGCPWHLVGLTGYFFRTMELAVQYARENPLAPT